MTNPSKKQSRWIKTVILLLAWSYLVYRLATYENYQLFWQQFRGLSIATAILLLTSTALLTVVNWGVESLKWKILISKIQIYSFAEAFKIVLAAIPLSIITPNRIGELPGRAYALPRYLQKSALGITAIGSVAQLSTTLLNGSIAVFYFLVYRPNLLEHIPYWQNYLQAALFFLLIIIVILFYTRRHAIGYYRGYLTKLMNYFSWTELSYVFILSQIRYFVFIIQFYLIQNLPGVNLIFTEVYFAQSLVYLLLTFLPIMSIFEIGVRSSVSVLIFGLFTPNEPGIVVASMLLWTFNLLLPALAGSYFLYRQK